MDTYSTTTLSFPQNQYFRIELKFESPTLKFIEEEFSVQLWSLRFGGAIVLLVAQSLHLVDTPT